MLSLLEEYSSLPAERKPSRFRGSKKFFADLSETCLNLSISELRFLIDQDIVASPAFFRDNPCGASLNFGLDDTICGDPFRQSFF